MECTLALISLCALAMWVRSGYMYDYAVRRQWEVAPDRSTGKTLELSSVSGWFQIAYHRSWALPFELVKDQTEAVAARASWDFHSSDAEPIGRYNVPETLKGGRGFWWLSEARYINGSVENHRHFMIHYGLLSSVAGAWPAGRLLLFLWARIGSLKKHRRQNRLCVACGYDLRATPDRCPECGVFSIRPDRAI